MDIKALVITASHCLLSQSMVSITHQPGWARNGFPLPVRRNPADEDGSVTQQYRPLALLEYAHEVLSGAIAAKRKETVV